MFDLRPLRSAAFRHLVGAYWVNEFGNWIGEIALTILTYDRTHSPLATAAFFLSVRFLPALLAPVLTARLETLRPRVVLAALYLLEAAFFAASRCSPTTSRCRPCFYSARSMRYSRSRPRH